MNPLNMKTKKLWKIENIPILYYCLSTKINIFKKEKYKNYL